jgi:uncharacterized protein involved in exopolysaccharide biosynthesis
MQSRYGETHPEIRKLKQEIADEEAAGGAALAAAAPVTVAAAPPTEPATPAARARRTPPPPQYSNPVLQSQLKNVEEEIGKHKLEQLRLNKMAAGYQAKLEAIPVRQQEITNLVRDYEISKAHYQQLLEKQLSAETATQLEIRQKGEKFAVLDPAQPAERPSRPNRPMINTAGALGGLGLGLLLALLTEFLGMSITAPEQIAELSGVPVLEVIPVIQTHSDRRVRKKRLIWATASGIALTVLASGAFLLYRYRN